MNTSPTISITIVSYNSSDCLCECLFSIRSIVRNGFVELIVVDNASPDESAALVERECPEAKVIHSEVNLGFAGGHNLAWSHAHADYWLLLNPDVVVPEGGLHRLVEWMDARPELGAASPEIVDDRGNVHCAGQRFPSIWLTLLELSRLHLLLPKRLRGSLLRGAYWPGGDQLDVDWVPGTAMIVRREAVVDAGLMSERFFMYGEDMEWCWRFRRAGWGVGVCSQVQVEHHEATSARRTWGEAESRRRLVRGICAACRAMRGPIYAWFYTLVNSLALWIEACHPRRSAGQRQQARSYSRAYFAVLCGR